MGTPANPPGTESFLPGDDLTFANERALDWLFNNPEVPRAELMGSPQEAIGVRHDSSASSSSAQQVTDPVNAFFFPPLPIVSPLASGPPGLPPLPPPGLDN
jgi:hypothetical protein